MPVYLDFFPGCFDFSDLPCIELLPDIPTILQPADFVPCRQIVNDLSLPDSSPDFDSELFA